MKLQSQSLMTSDKKSWNSGQAVGPKSNFALSQTKQIEQFLLRDQNWHDLALLSFALDSMFRASDLLKVTVKSVTYLNGDIRSELRYRQQKTDQNVFPVLTKATQNYLAIWINVSGKVGSEFLFTRYKRPEVSGLTRHISRGYYASLVKDWASWLGLPVEDYSTHSLRRSKPCWMFEQGEQLETISKLLGHKSTEVTLRYLGIDQMKAAAAALRHPMMQGPSSDLMQRLGRKGCVPLSQKGQKTVKSI